MLSYKVQQPQICWYCCIEDVTVTCFRDLLASYQALSDHGVANDLNSVGDSVATRGGHYHRSRVAICDRDQDVLIRKNGFDRLILLTNAA